MGTGKVTQLICGEIKQREVSSQHVCARVPFCQDGFIFRGVRRNWLVKVSEGRQMKGHDLKDKDRSYRL